MSTTPTRCDVGSSWLGFKAPLLVLVDRQSRRRLGLPKRATTARQARIGHEVGVRTEPAVDRFVALISAIGLELPAIGLILEIGDPLVGRLLLVDVMAMRFEEIAYGWNPKNPLTGDV